MITTSSKQALRRFCGATHRNCELSGITEGVPLRSNPVRDSQSKNDPQSAQRLLLVDFRLAPLAIGEENWRFAHPGAEPFEPPEDFFLKRVAATFDGGKIELP